MKVYLSLGANLGQRGETLREALRRLSCLPRTRLLAWAPLYETAPWGKTDQPPFLNTAALIDTALEPLVLLHHTQQLEYDLGRVRHEHWGARTIDIDLLAAEGFSMDTDELKMPHPYLTQRAFVLHPLRDIAPELLIAGRRVADWCQEAEIACQEIRLAPEVCAPYPLSMIACVDEHMGIGRDGKLLLQDKEDMAHFRQETLGQVVIMGRRTWDSLPGRKPLPDRINIVLSRSLQCAEVQVCADLPALWEVLGRIQQEHPEKKFICIGGGEIYSLLMPYAQELLLTEAAGTFAADTFFPAVEGFCEAARENRPGLSFVRLVREN